MSTHILASLRSKLVSKHGKFLLELQKRNFSTDEIIVKRNELFNYEQKRQRESIGRIEKIEVRYLGVPQDETLIMNKNISTPYNCAQHLSEHISKTTVLALVNNNLLWDMHRPLDSSCTIQLLNFKSADPASVNRAFWRSCSFILGAVLQRIFKSEAGLFLHSFPKPNVRSGSFIHDFALNEKNWKPTVLEMKTISVEMQKFALENHKFERLTVNHDVAFEMFKDNPFKREQLPNISNSHNGQVTLYRASNHIDISGGPMIGNTNVFQRARISAVHKVSKEEDTCNLYRIQGIALPAGFNLSYYAMNLLADRAKKLNPARLPQEAMSSESDHFDGPAAELRLIQNAN